MNEPTFDKDGGPTEETLEAIKNWPTNDPQGCLDFLSDCWSTKYGEVEFPTDPDKPFMWKFTTGGWSDNEALMFALKSNFIIWGKTWERSERGGVYHFKIDRDAPKVEESESEPDGYIILVGSLGDGFQAFVGPHGLPFCDHEEALEAAEQHDTWSIMGVFSCDKTK